jgi:phage internal scaffolding protein
MAKNELFVRSQYNYDRDAASRESALTCLDPSLAVQDQRDEVDINTIVRRFGLTGKLPDMPALPTYGDFADVTDYHSAMNAVVKANESFDSLPADIRARFHNDPGAFVDFCSNPQNGEELVKMGLGVKKEVPVEPIPVVVPEVKPAVKAPA